MILTSGRRVRHAGGYPHVSGGIVSAAGILVPFVIMAAPNDPFTADHFTASISLPVQTAVGPDRAVGALLLVVAVQLSVLGSYLPPVPIAGVAVGVGVGLGPGVNCVKDLSTGLK